MLLRTVKIVVLNVWKKDYLCHGIGNDIDMNYWQKIIRVPESTFG